MSPRDPFPLGFRVTEVGQVVDLRDDRREFDVNGCHLCGANAEQACAAPSARLTFYNVQCPRKR